MTVQDLIDLLATYPSGLRVVVNGYEDGFDDVVPERVSVIQIELDVGQEWWEGRHNTADHAEPARRDSRIVDALVLRRAPHPGASGR